MATRTTCSSGGASTSKARRAMLRRSRGIFARAASLRAAAVSAVTSGSTPEAADAIDRLYGAIITKGTHKASSIEVAEAAKIIENTQRDLNIALMNELAIIFHKIGIDTPEVLAAASTKWNFLPFKPGLTEGSVVHSVMESD